MKHLIIHIILFIICCETFAQSSSEAINFSDKSNWKLIPDRDVCIEDTTTTNRINFRKFHLKYNKDLYLSRDDLEYILYNIHRKAKWQQSPSQNRSLIEVFPWEDIYTCLSNKTIFWGQDVRWSPLLCDKCKRHTITFYFTSPKWTWKKMCGRGGDMFLCPFCVRQVEFLCGIMN